MQTIKHTFKKTRKRTSRVFEKNKRRRFLYMSFKVYCAIITTRFSYCHRIMGISTDDAGFYLEIK